MLGNMIGLSSFGAVVQMWRPNTFMLSSPKTNNEIRLKREYQLKHKNISRENIAIDKKIHSLKNGFEVSKL